MKVILFLLTVIGSLTETLSVHIYPPGFSQVQISHGVANPAVYDFAPDGRVLVREFVNYKSGRDSQSVRASYNPAKKGLIILSISGYKARTKAFVTITDINGHNIFLDKVSCDITCERAVINIEGKFPKGSYIIHVKIEGKSYSQKIIIS